jgi:hypothetical protein
MIPRILKLSIGKIIWFKAWGKVLIFKRLVWPAFFIQTFFSFLPICTPLAGRSTKSPPSTEDWLVLKIAQFYGGELVRPPGGTGTPEPGFA